MIGLGSNKSQAKPKPKPTQTVSRPDDQLGAKPAKDWLWPGENDDEKNNDYDDDDWTRLVLRSWLRYQTLSNGNRWSCISCMLHSFTVIWSQEISHKFYWLWLHRSNHKYSQSVNAWQEPLLEHVVTL